MWYVEESASRNISALEEKLEFDFWLEKLIYMLSDLSCPRLLVEMGLWCNLNMLLTCNKKEADQSLTWGIFLTQPNEIFWSEGQKIEKFGIFGGNFPNPEVAADPTKPE